MTSTPLPSYNITPRIAVRKRLLWMDFEVLTVYFGCESPPATRYMKTEDLNNFTLYFLYSLRTFYHLFYTVKCLHLRHETICRHETAATTSASIAEMTIQLCKLNRYGNRFAAPTLRWRYAVECATRLRNSEENFYYTNSTWLYHYMNIDVHNLQMYFYYWIRTCSLPNFSINQMFPILSIGLNT